MGIIHVADLEDDGLSQSDDFDSKPTVEDIGKEFFEWADKSWGLGDLVDRGIRAQNSLGNGESCSYDAMKKYYFINKINQLAKDKYEK